MLTPKLKGTYKIAYADCFAAALTMKLKATLVTGDPEFQQIEKLIDIEWISARTKKETTE